MTVNHMFDVHFLRDFDVDHLFFDIATDQ